LWDAGEHDVLDLMRALDFIIRYLLSLAWLLLMSVVGVLLIPFLFGNLNFNHYVARFGSSGLRFITRVRIQLEGVQSLESLQPCIYVANHQDNFDVMIFGSVFPRKTIVIGKRELIWVPFFNLFYYAAGNIFLNRRKRRQAIAGIEEAGARIRERGVSVMIFPEGTRNKSGHGLLPFKKGAFHMAVEAGLPIVPLVASPIKPVLDYGRLRLTPGTIRIRVLEPISTRGLAREDIDALAQSCRDRMLKVLESYSSS
jgi:1-acyl-sn-glycerol-3-phosphate acyltransferase